MNPANTPAIEPLKTSELTPDKIELLAFSEPIVYQFYCAWRRGEITWEEALIGMVLNLHESKERIIKDLILDPNYPGPIDQNFFPSR